VRCHDQRFEKFLYAISTTLKRLARRGDTMGMCAYIQSDGFLRAFNGVDPERHRSAR